MQDPDGSGSGLVVVNLGVGDAGIIVNDRVHERVPELRIAPLVLRPPRSGSSVSFSLEPADVALATAVGDVPELLHVHVHQGAGVIVLVTTDRFPSRAVDVRESVESRDGEDAMHR